MKNLISVFVVCIWVMLLNISCANEEKKSNVASIFGIISDAQNTLPLKNVQVTTLPPTQSILTDVNGAFFLQKDVQGDQTYQIN